MTTNETLAPASGLAANNDVSFPQRERRVSQGAHRAAR